MSGQKTIWRGGRAPVVTGLILICTAVELLLQLSDLRLLPGGAVAGRLRSLAYQYGAFWPGLLHNWRPNFPGQAGAMFVTYAFLHGGLLHLAMNMMTLASLGAEICARAGQGWFLRAYAVSAVTGAIAFGILGQGVQPMVGASGALFGLAGVILTWRARAAAARHLSLAPVMQVLALLIGINVVMWWAMDGMLAWQTHLGGFLGGVAVAWLSPPSRRTHTDPRRPGSPDTTER